MTTPKELHLSEVKVGDIVFLDAGFNCHDAGTVIIRRGKCGDKCFECKDGNHYLSGQTDKAGFLVGMSRHPFGVPKEESQCFLIWSPDRGYPTKKHSEGNVAKKEAERLAKENPGNCFYVMKAVGFAEKPKTEDIWIDLE